MQTAIEQVIDSEMVLDRTLFSRAVGWAERHPVISVFAIALILRFTVVAVTNLFFEGQFAGDDTTYRELAIDAVNGTKAGWLPYDFELYRETFAFTGPLTFLFRVFGPNLVIAATYTAIIGAGAAALTTFVGLELTSRRFALLGGLLVAALPSQVLFSSLLLKDSSVWLVLAALTLVVAIAGRLEKSWHLTLAFLAAATLLFLMAYLREHTLVIVCWALVLTTPFIGLKKTRLARSIGVVALGTMVPLIIGIGPWGWSLIADGPALAERRLNNALAARTAFVNDYLAAQEARQTAVSLESETGELKANLAAIYARISTLESEGGASAEIAELEDQAVPLQEEITQREEELAEIKEEIATFDTGFAPNLAHYPRGVIAILFEPFPWSGGATLSHNLARFESVIWYALLALALVGVTQVRKHLRVLAFPVVATIAIVSVYALTEGNVGTAFRHRGEIVATTAVLAVFGIRKLWGSRSIAQTEITA